MTSPPRSAHPSDLRFEALSSEHRDDPYPIYRRLRDEAPVYRSPESGLYCVSRYEDVHRVLADSESFSSKAMLTVLMAGGMKKEAISWRMVSGLLGFLVRTRLNPLSILHSRNLISEDGDSHGAMRRVLNRGFTPRQMKSWEARVGEVVDECLAPLRAGEDFDWVGQLATPLPVRIIAEMLGIPPEDQQDFKRWSDSIIHNAAGPGRADPFRKEFMRDIRELWVYLQRAIAERRREPGDDLISLILAEQDSEMALSEMEVVQFVQLLLIAGNETTTHLLGNALTALFDHEEALERVADDPEIWVPCVIEETLRFDPPIQMVFRTARRDVEIAGVEVREGEHVAALLASANRDERRFPDPDRFDLERGSSGTGHLGFGFGKHFCLGSALARLEAGSALRAIAPALPQLLRKEPVPPRVDSFLVRGPTRLQLSHQSAGRARASC